MNERVADARPEKHLFLEMFVRDLTLEDAILDLIDNSVDSLIRRRNIDISEALEPSAGPSSADATSTRIAPATINIVLNHKHFEIVDNCGGIPIDEAETEVFRFGHSKEATVGQLGVYGIGLKRAIFKIGDHITIESKTLREGFRMLIDVPKWSVEPAWELPFEVTGGTGDPTTAGTSITIKSYRPEVLQRLQSGRLEGHLKEMIARTYCLFLNRYVTVTLNGYTVEPDYIPLGSSSEVTIAKEAFEDDGVAVTIYAGLAARDEDGQWRAADAGWYVACNGRLVVSADKTELSGWGTGLGTFVPKYRGFIGIVFFYSRDPLSLPWTTTKRGLNQESLVFQRTRTRMAAIARPVLKFLDDMYSSEERERQPQRQVASSVKPQDVRVLTTRSQSRFEARVQPIGDHSVRVQYDAKERELELVRKTVGRRSWSAAKIGRYTFEHFIKTECPE